VLTGLIKRILTDPDTVNIRTSDDFASL